MNSFLSLGVLWKKLFHKIINNHVNYVNIQFFKVTYTSSSKVTSGSPGEHNEVQLFNLAVIDHRIRFLLKLEQTCSNKDYFSERRSLNNVTCQKFAVLSKLRSGLSGKSTFPEHAEQEVDNRPC